MGKISSNVERAIAKIATDEELRTVAGRLIVGCLDASQRLGALEAASGCPDIFCSREKLIPSTERGKGGRGCGGTFFFTGGREN